LRTESIHTVFCQRMQLKPGEFVLQVSIPARYIDAPFYHVKKTAIEKIDYPLLSISALLYENTTRAAMSGLYSYPFRSAALETAINSKNLTDKQKIESAVASLLEAPMKDYQGSSEYRLFVLKQSLSAMMEVMGR